MTGPVWIPSQAVADASNVERYRHWLSTHRGLDLTDYAALHAWSVAEPAQFWGSLWEYFDILGSPYEQVLASAAMPGARWFTGARLNYVDQVFRHVRDGVAIIDEPEPGQPGRQITWAELRRQVASVANTLRELGVAEGDRVVGYLPNIAEAVVAFLATASLGAIWSSCGQDYSAPAAVARLGQLAPKVLFTADGYRYNGREQDRREAISLLRREIPSLEATIAVSRLGLELDGVTPWSADGDFPLEPAAVPFDHPLWVLFSSGTTGKPKGIVHGHGGVVIEHVKALSLHLDLGPSDTFFWYTSPSWMMWNYQVAGLLVGATIVCHDGNPGYPTPGALWELAARLDVTVLGTSPAYLQASEKAGVHPSLPKLRTLGATGSVVPPAAYRWVATELGSHVALASTSGGTDVVTAFAGAVPTVPIWTGEMSAPCLGVALAAWDAHGRALVDEVGELVVTQPMPSMPLSFWDDPDGHRYHDAYFAVYPGVWRHGDWITMTSHGTVVVHGRSDSTLNRNGVRMGSADIYAVVEKLPEIVESLVIGAEQDDGGYWMPLFVVLADGVELTDDLKTRIAAAIRQDASPRHVPDEIIAVPGVPHTRTGKKLEVPVKRLLQGAATADVVDPQSVDDAGLLDVFADLSSRRSRRRP
ncbi:acetoacetate--CoA ligase [Kutzneria buriramensis]|uniref:Acetoacetyl-CoA synthetase n=1 Tax=Kutzneria buriramensis TaxID=1045776 RepID=A0A3E0H535_9PSEU|nr:acetoacetate--CoA ligase [Kutzneria buriramensis]REH38186.1 acetoacetyl-CoA synthetase [Kutzneria buriramensis]